MFVFRSSHLLLYTHNHPPPPLYSPSGLTRLGSTLLGHYRLESIYQLSNFGDAAQYTLVRPPSGLLYAVDVYMARDGSRGLVWPGLVCLWWPISESSGGYNYFCNRCKFYYSINLHSGQVVLLSNYRRYSPSFRLIWCLSVGPVLALD